MAAPADKIWDLIADVRNTGRFSPEVLEAEWLGDATGPALGAKFRGHVRRNEIGPVYWTTCEVTACEPGREFGFAVLLGDRPVNNWHYRIGARGRRHGRYRVISAHPVCVHRRVYFWLFGGWLRKRRNIRDMTKTLKRIKDCGRGGLTHHMKSIFITGAGSGMGREGAKLFHAKGWRVGAVDRNGDGLAELSRELGRERLWTRVVDVTDKAVLDGALADFCAGNAGAALDMMWNNAGIGEGGWFEDVPYEAAMRVVDVNFKAVLTGAYGALPHLKKAPGSLMFSTSSSSGTYGMPRLAVYSATKHAVKGLTEALSVEWQRHGVRVADVLPGLIDTPMLITTPNHSEDAAASTRSADEIRATAPKKGLLRLMPATSVAEVAWQAYQHPTRLHWYVPNSIRWIDRLKGLSPEWVRGRIVKELPALISKPQQGIAPQNSPEMESR